LVGHVDCSIARAAAGRAPHSDTSATKSAMPHCNGGGRFITSDREFVAVCSPKLTLHARCSWI
jgi:hypothetical protein